MNCFFVSDLHGFLNRFHRLFERIKVEKPAALFLGGDILPGYLATLTGKPLNQDTFIPEFLVPELKKLKVALKQDYPEIFLIFGNDDGRKQEKSLFTGQNAGMFHYCHCRPVKWREFTVYGYAYIPPSPFLLKDWERYDESLEVNPGCIAPESGKFTEPVSQHHLKSATIHDDLIDLTAGADFQRSIFLFHSPPYQCSLDRIDAAKFDLHVGSKAIKRFILQNQPLLTLHGHIHESTRLTGQWQEKFNRTVSFNASHDGPELALIRFNPHCPQKATRELIE